MGSSAVARPRSFSVLYPAVRIGVPREIAPRETRVALVPETVARLKKSGLDVLVEPGAGAAATHSDDAYREAGAAIAPGSRDVWAEADVVLCVRAPRIDERLGVHQVDAMREGAALIGFLRPSRHPGLLAKLEARRITAFSMDQVPRISRAQKMDALSSMSTVAGYKAVLLGAVSLGKFFPLFMTAAGTIPPAKVFVLGAGVAGLQAIATARRLGAVVEAFDVRPAVREEVQSLGATFVSVELTSESAVGAGGYAKEQSEEFHQRERDLLARHVATADVVITTAMIPGRPAPRLITEEMVQRMRPGSVIVDLAAEEGGNCALTKPGERTVAHGVAVLGPLDLVTEMPVHASAMYSRNIAALLLHLVHDGQLHLDFDDEVTRGSCVTHEGRPLEATAGQAT
ncbi:MAG TPA: Re/Si-specific NAD(P)(+) transhydrogenase subunit alpha [Candidatus Limnocylindria bacterium]|nr:Re/Si-specific NAD(P)(+) transhydrogenase subunit alpha [Candidatus Limnocylindria bacterium]